MTHPLRSLALTATPGPWTIGYDERECAATLRASPVTSGQAEPCGPPIDVIIPFGRAHSDAAFIAAAHPQAVLDLLDECERLKAARDEAEAIVHAEERPTRRDLRLARHRVSELEAQLAAVTAERDALVKTVRFLRYFEIPDDAIKALTDRLCTALADTEHEGLAEDAAMNIEQLRRQRDEAIAQLAALTAQREEQ